MAVDTIDPCDKSPGQRLREALAKLVRQQASGSAP